MPDQIPPAPSDPLPPSGPLAVYEEKVSAGGLRADGEQRRAAERLDALWRELEEPAEPPSLFTRMFGRGRRPRQPRGVYLVGQVGRGKSMLMDLFFEQAAVAKKRRVHFHRFMQEAHREVHRLKKERPEMDDPIPPLADGIVSRARLLCFDEFQVNDIADAMILGRLFDALFARGAVVVATSNTVPDELFQNRPGADSFKPFIARINAELDTVVLDSPHDYRRGGLRGLPTWHVPADDRAERALDAAFARLADAPETDSEVLEVMGRRVPVPLSAGGVARFDFEALCGANLGAGDYLALATRYPNLILDAVPRLGEDNFDRARRFIVLVDALYEAKVKLLASAE
ncbi:MAG: AFG1 family ATPase, partial [Gluconacetobacter diazotrophicus]|nr:AFG1 family ATPase [Gluconacetobacter diazotrophicus]